MFEQVPFNILQRAMHPPVLYGRQILAETVRSLPELRHAELYIILTQPEALEAALEQFSVVEGSRAIYLPSMDDVQTMGMNSASASTASVDMIGGRQAATEA